MKMHSFEIQNAIAFWLAGNPYQLTSNDEKRAEALFSFLQNEGFSILRTEALRDIAEERDNAIEHYDESQAVLSALASLVASNGGLALKPPVDPGEASSAIQKEAPGENNDVTQRESNTAEDTFIMNWNSMDGDQGAVLRAIADTLDENPNWIITSLYNSGFDHPGGLEVQCTFVRPL